MAGIIRCTLLLAIAVAPIACDSAPLGSDPSEQELHAALNASPVVEQTSNIFDEFGTGSGVTGTATLTRTSSGVWMTGNAEGLVPGHAFTIWFVVFDNSKGCGNNGCGPEDLESPQAQVTLANAGGFVADESGTFHAHMIRHDLEGRQLLLGDASGIDNTYQGEVHAIIRSHGVAEKDPTDLAMQTSLVGAFCNLPAEVDPSGCQDQGVVIFGPAGAPGAS